MMYHQLVLPQRPYQLAGIGPASNGLLHVPDNLSDLGGIPRQAYYGLRYP